MRLSEELQKYADSAPVRFHMPGHKGISPEDFLAVPGELGAEPEDEGFALRELGTTNIYERDITEIPGFDDLHNPEDSIRDLENEIGKLYSVKSAILSVNGSTAGILSAVFALVSQGGKALISRSCHKSVYHALALRGADIIFYYEDYDQYGIEKPIDLVKLKGILDSEENIDTAIFTNPTYKGVVSNTKDISNVLKSYNIPLLVDAAHGAHLGALDREWPHPITEGADIAVTSFHKTLPMLTQTACVLFSGEGGAQEEKDSSREDERAPRELWRGESYYESVRYWMSYFETSSPSYVLMESVSRGIDLILEKGEDLYKALLSNIRDFRKEANSLKNIKIYSADYTDKTKILILAPAGEPMNTAMESFREKNIVPEMFGPNFILCMSSIMNKKQDFDMLLEALRDADGKIKSQGNLNIDCFLENNPPESIMPLHEAVNKRTRLLPLEEAAGQGVGVFIDIFPPGVPLLIPGEKLEKHHVDLVKNQKVLNINIRGLIGDKIPVITE